MDPENRGGDETGLLSRFVSDDDEALTEVPQ